MQELDGSAVQFSTSYFGVSVRSEAYYHGETQEHHLTSWLTILAGQQLSTFVSRRWRR
jgi:hypothetical protein